MWLIFYSFLAPIYGTDIAAETVVESPLVKHPHTGYTYLLKPLPSLTPSKFSPLHIPCSDSFVHNIYPWSEPKAILLSAAPISGADIAAETAVGPPPAKRARIGDLLKPLPSLTQSECGFLYTPHAIQLYLPCHLHCS